MIQQPTINLLIENTNYPQQLSTVIDGIGKQVGKANSRLKDTRGGISVESSYKNLIHDTAKLEMLKLKDSELENIRYGLGGSHLWIAVKNERNEWGRVAIVTFENFA